MAEPGRQQTGTILWTDLTVDNAEELKSFYREVVGWTPQAVDMGGYSDFNMCAPSSGSAVAGICHARGSNAELPPQWLVYIAVDDMKRSVARAIALGGRVLVGPRAMGPHVELCVIQDPAGAVAALMGPP